MDYERMQRVFHCMPEADAVNAEGNILGIKDGLCLSRPADSYDNHNTAVIGSSGTMKTMGVVMNSIIGCARRGESMVINDPKSELFDKSAAWLEEQGYTVRVLNLKDLDRSHSWNPLEAAFEGVEESDVLATAVWVAKTIIANAKGIDTPTPDFFRDMARSRLLEAGILYQYCRWKEGAESLTLSKAHDFILNNDLTEIENAINNLQETPPRNAAKELFEAFKRAGGSAVRNIQFGLLLKLNMFTNADLRRKTNDNEIDITLPAKEKCAYFVITSDIDRTHDLISCLFYTALHIKIAKYADATNEGKCPVPVNFLLDEFPSIGIIPDFAVKVAASRGRNMKYTIVFQSVPQIEMLYPIPCSNSILNCCDYIVFSGTDDIETAAYIGDRIKKDSEFVLKIPKGKALLIRRGEPALECEMFFYTRNPEAAAWN